MINTKRVKKMCLAIPAKVLEINEKIAKVDFGKEVIREVNIMLVDVKVGEYILFKIKFIQSSIMCSDPINSSLINIE